MGKEKRAVVAKDKAAKPVETKRDAAPKFCIFVDEIPDLVDDDVTKTKRFFENLLDFSNDRKFRLTLHFDEERNFAHTMTITAFSRDLAEELMEFNGWEVRKNHHLVFTRLYE